MSRLAERVALVTGATSGLGEAIALGFARQGARVVVCGRRADLGEAVAAAIRAAGGQGAFIAADVSEEAQADALVAATVAKYGRLDIAVNNAGLGAANARTADIPTAEFDAVLGTNLRGVWLCMRAEIRRFLVQGEGGCIINMGSVLGHVATSAASRYSAAHYVAAKHAVEGLSKTAAADYGRDGIRVNTIAPGIVATAISAQVMTEEAPVVGHWRQRTALGRLATVDDVVGAAVFLASDEAAYVTGASLAVDGGYRAQ